MIFCQQCGAPNDPSASVCRNCGTARPAATTVAVPVAVPSQPAASAAYGTAPLPAKKKNGKALKIIGITGAVLIALFIALVVLGAVIDARKNGGRGPSAPSESSEKAPSAPSSGRESKPATLPIPSEEQRAGDGHRMCTLIRLELKDELKTSGIQCEPASAGDAIDLVVAYPLPILVEDGPVRENTLYVTSAIAGIAAAQYPKTTVNKIYVMDSTQTAFAVPAEFARQIATKIMNKQISALDAKNEIAREAKRVPSPSRNH
jgi:zinc ribbon protein